MGIAQAREARRWQFLVTAGAFGAAVAYALRALKPFDGASLGRDAAAPVIHFQRLIAGERLETYLGITPKPLITLVNGVTYSLFADWRPVAWLEILAFASCVALAALLALRLGGFASAAFAGAGLLLSAVMLDEIAFIHAVPWALLGCLVAGVAVVRERPRYGIAGIALAAAILARLEVALVPLLAIAVLLALEVRARASGTPPPDRRAYLVSTAFLALPIMCLHDALLAGDPLLWAKIAETNSNVAGTAQGPAWVTEWIGRHLAEHSALLVLAALGTIRLVRDRQWAMLVGLGALVPGVTAFLIFMAARGIFFSARYVATIDLGLVFLAALGLSLVDIPVARAWIRRQRWPRPATVVLSIAVGATMAVLLAPVGRFDPALVRRVAKQADLLENQRDAIAVIRNELATTADGATTVRGRILVPARVREQTVVDLGLTLDRVPRTNEVQNNPAADLIAPGDIVYHDRLDDPDSAMYRLYEIEMPTRVGDVQLRPLLADSARGIWVVAVDAAPSP